MTKPIRYQSVTVSLQNTDEEIDAAADQMGLSGGEELKRLLTFAGQIRTYGEESDLVPPQLISALLDFVAQILRDCYTPEQHGELIGDLTQQLWILTGLDPENQATETTH
jgi:hypothetical protein